MTEKELDIKCDKLALKIFGDSVPYPTIGVWIKEFAKEIINDSLPVEAVVKPANGGQIYLLYKRLLGYSDMTPILVAVFAGVEKALDEKYKLQKDDHANSYFIEDSRLSV